MEKSTAEKPEAIPVSLILSGGLALGAYQAGVLEAFDESGLLDTVAAAGSSIGALNSALFVGNPPDRRSARGCYGAVFTIDATVSSMSRRAMLKGWGRRGRRSMPNQSAASISPGCGTISPLT